jgi:L-alanine-DL-glutamate epimerase-like enolase superfamily enzyme
MKITDVTTRTRTAPLRMPFVTALRTVTEVVAIDAVVRTDDGAVGYGEAVATPVITGDTVGSIDAALSNELRAAVLGRELDDFEDLLRRVQTAMTGNRSAKAALDIALHDLRAKALGLPLYRLLGAGSSTARTDVTVGVDTPAAMAEQAAARVAEGFATLKLKVAVDPRVDVERVRRVRDAVGPDVALRLDANQGWTAKQAVAIVTTLERGGVELELVEQPVPAHDLAGLAFVRDHIAAPVMADESVATPADALEVIRRGAADLINIKLMKAGGLRPARQLADIAAAAGIGTMVGGMMATGLGVAADAALAATLPEHVVHDLDPAWWLAESDGFVRYEGDRVLLRDMPGVSA